MLQGLKYGMFYFGLIPAILYLALGGNTSTIDSGGNNAFYGTTHYEFFVIYVIASLAFIHFLLCLITKANPKLISVNADSIIEQLLFIRQKSLTFKFMSLALFVYSIANYFYIDHSVHWLSRHELEILPKSLKFYINPIFSFFIFISMVNIAANVASPAIKNINRKGKILKYSWLLLDIVIVALLMYNSGNRWYIAAIFSLIFYLSTFKIKAIICMSFPGLVILGSFISVYILSLRVGQDFYIMLESMLYNQDITSLLGKSVMLITEGVNLLATFLVAKLSLYSFNPEYMFEKILYMPLPSSLVDKPLPFNILVSSLVYGEVTSHSVNSLLFASFIYSFGILSILFFIIFIGLMFVVDKKHHNLDMVPKCIFFLMAFSSVRFNFDYLLPHFVYFLLLIRYYKKYFIACKFYTRGIMP
ncbi:hypothetical protein [Cobetia amphilecti]|uniref:hypothetical protein n=1 Tax=Cobetia amphilecti TaxID=1055104 RepID=UPI00329A5C6D